MSNVVAIYRRENIVAGKTTPPRSGKYTDVKNPANGEKCGEAAESSAKDVDIAVNAAHQAFQDTSWRNMPANERAKVLYQLSNILLANTAELTTLESLECGGPITRIQNLDFLAVADVFVTLADAIKEFDFVENLPPRIAPEPVHTAIYREPIGVCGLITAWNFPLLLLSWKIAPALATGNTVVIKPSEFTPSSTHRVVELFNQILPPGVLNIVHGKKETGEAIVQHPLVKKVSFTGSTATGIAIQKSAAESVKRVTLELGGKGAALVLEDANIDLTAHAALFGILMNSGQACEAASRLLVHDSIHDALIDKMVEIASKISIGDPLDPATKMGPIINQAQFEKIMRYIDSAKANGANIVCGGQRKIVDGFENGYFIEPTIITESADNMPHACEEIFGPVLSVFRFSDIEQAISIANESDYGLSAGIFSEDVIKAQSIAKQLQAGSVWINDWHMMRTDAPFGGFKQSGYGREMGKESLKHYTETKSVSTAFENNPHRKGPMHLVLNV